VVKIDRILRVRDVDDRRPILFDVACQRIQRLPGMMSDISDPSLFPGHDLSLDLGLIGRPGLKCVVTD